MELKEKEFIKYKLGLCLQSIIEENSAASDQDKDNHPGVSSIRGLAAASELEYSIVQKVTSGKKNPEFTTLVSLAEGLNMKLSELIIKYENITDAEVIAYIELLREKKQEREKKKKATSKKGYSKSLKITSNKSITKKKSQKP